MLGEDNSIAPGLLESLGVTPSTPILGTWLEDDDRDRECNCRHDFDADVLLVDASDCNGDLASTPSCRRSVVKTLVDRGAGELVVRSNALERRYEAEGVSLLAAAGRFIDMLGGRDDRLATAAAIDPLAVAEEAAERPGPVGDVAATAGLLSAAAGIDAYADVLTPTIGMTIAHYAIEPKVPRGAQLVDVRTLETGSQVRIYERPDSVPLYAVEVVDTTLTGEQRQRIVDGYEAIAEGAVEGERSASRAIRHVTGSAGDPLVVSVLQKHTDGYGILEDLFADSRVTDVYATAPVSSNPLRVVCDGESMATNVRLSPEGVASLASRIRRTSGRAFSRANPTVDATITLDNGTGVRIAGVTDPVADGIAFAFREQADDRFTLPELVANGTMRARAAALLSVAIERSAATLVAGTRGAGKTTLLGTLLYELSPDTRTVVIEDTPELPVGPLQSVDRDVQALRTGTGDGPEITPAEALRTALRLGDGALVVGEIRGEEARVLYEAMRVGANANAVLGTIHGDGADDVYERVVSDLQVEPSSFSATDLVVTVQAVRTPHGKQRRLARIEEVLGSGSDVWFEPLFELHDDLAEPTGRIDRGESRLIDRLTRPGEDYADVRASIAERERTIERLAGDGRTSPEEVATAYARRGVIQP